MNLEGEEKRLTNNIRTKNCDEADMPHDDKFQFDDKGGGNFNSEQDALLSPPAPQGEVINPDEHAPMNRNESGASLLSESAELEKLRARLHDVEALLGLNEDPLQTQEPTTRSKRMLMLNLESASSRMTLIEDEIVKLRRGHTHRNETERRLPQDSFSFFMISPVKSVPFSLAFLVLFFQMITFSLVLLDLLSEGDDGNRLAIPGNVAWQLRATQAIAIFVAVFTQGDLMTAFQLLRDGYCQPLQDAYTHIAYWKYAGSLGARLVEGAVGLAVSFLLIVTAESVVDLILNFTAIEFVSNLDEVLFVVSIKGFMGRRCKTAAFALSVTWFDIERIHQRKWKAVLLLMILAVMLAGWAVVFQLQISGRYLCHTILVQFGDDFVPALGAHTGLFDLSSSNYAPFADHRVEYVERRSKELGLGTATFAYCNEMGTWTFGWAPSGVEHRDACDWIAKSSTTDTFDITETILAPWYVRDEDGREVVLSPFFLGCVDCSVESDCKGHGICDRGVCRCEGRVGLRCGFPLPCNEISVNVQTENFASTRDWAVNYTVLEDHRGLVEAYYRPIYINLRSERDFDVIVFTGRRWALTSSEFLPLQPSTTPADFFRNYFHALMPNITLAFLSEPTDIQTPKDKVSPVGLQWFSANARTLTNASGFQSPERAITTVLLCPICNDLSNPCLYGGQCLGGTCSCAPGSLGHLCQIPPVGNGNCDDFFNTPEFKLDGGDCCSSTCTSTPDYQCGNDASGNVSIGYPSCQLSHNKRRAHGSPIVGDNFARSGFSVALSRTGTHLAIAEVGKSRERLFEAGTNKVRLFDQDGSQWVERAASPPVDFKINGLALSSGPSNLLPLLTFIPPLMVAIAGIQNDGKYAVLVYFCELQSCAQMARFEGATCVDISADGSTVAYGIGYRLNNPAQVEVIRLANIYNFRQFGLSPFEKVGTVFPLDARNATNSSFVKSVSLSEDGEVISVEALDFTGSRVCDRQDSKSCGDGADLSSLVFARDGTSFKQLGSDLGNKFEYISDYTTLLSRPSLVLSGDGRSVAYTHRRLHQVFVWRGNEWAEKGFIPSCLPNCEDPTTVSFKEFSSLAISRDGSTVVVGENDDFVRVFDWDGTSWQQVGDIFPSDPRVSVALSANTDMLAIGRPYDGLNDYGSTTLYSIIQDCPEGESKLRVFVTPPLAESYWTLKSSSSGINVTRGDYSWGLYSTADEFCLAENECYQFTFHPYNWQECLAYMDQEEDFLTPSGRYDLFFDNHRKSDQLITGQAPYRSYVGNTCYSCPTGTDLLRIGVHSCFDTKITWSLTAETNETIALFNEGPLHGFPDDTRCSESGDCMTWEAACIDFRKCHSFAIGEQRRTLISSRQGLLGLNETGSNGTSVISAVLFPQYAILRNDEVLASGTRDDGSYLLNATHEIGTC